MKTVLIVEDDEVINHALRVRLKNAGYRVQTAFDAVQATSQAVRSCPDLMILDIAIPGGSGFDLADRLQDLPETAGTPMIFLTASSDPRYPGWALERGAHAFLRKPYDPSMLLDMVDDATC